MMGKGKKNRHEIGDWVGIYSQWEFLLEPERIILEKLNDQLPSMKMLDIGVGGGRTTSYCATVAREYVGIDFDDNMIQACRNKFPGTHETISFLTCDARSMNVFDDAYFDFILFSFNGLDYLCHEDRLKALREIKRVGKVGAYFLMSSHNLNSIDRLFTAERTIVDQLLRDPVRFCVEAFRDAGKLRRLVGYIALRWRNGKVERLQQREYAMIYDGVYSKRLKWLVLSIWRQLGMYYYVRPEAQIRQLERIGFEVIEIYAGDTRFDTMGVRRINSKSELSEVTDYWLHYFCEIVDS